MKALTLVCSLDEMLKCANGMQKYPFDAYTVTYPCEAKQKVTVGLCKTPQNSMRKSA